MLEARRPGRPRTCVESIRACSVTRGPCLNGWQAPQPPQVPRRGECMPFEGGTISASALSAEAPVDAQALASPGVLLDACG